MAGVAGSEVYEEGALVLVRDQYQPLNPMPAVVHRYSSEPPRPPHLVWVTFRESGMAAWIDASRIIGRDTRAAEDRRDDR
jgi:hypothetical protein